jgi:hypothetical protein
VSAMIAVEPQVLFGQPQGRNEEVAARRGQVRFLVVPAHRFVMLDGAGAPEENVFAERIPGLYAAAYSLHFALRRRAVDTRVGPLEGLWWSAEDAKPWQEGGWEWRWSLMIALPDEATDVELDACLAAGRLKLAPELARALRVESFDEGRCAQLLHIGPYAKERPSIEMLLDAIRREGLAPRGRHHEIYLGDPRRSAPERLRTVLRQPVV